MAVLMYRKSYLKSVVIAVIACFVLASAETITLHDGSVVTGTITGQTETKITVKTPHGTLTIDKANISSVDYGSGGKRDSQQQQNESRIAVSTEGNYRSGYDQGKLKGYEDGHAAGVSEQRSARLLGSIVGWLCSLAVVAFVMAIATASTY